MTTVLLVGTMFWLLNYEKALFIIYRCNRLFIIYLYAYIVLQTSPETERLGKIYLYQVDKEKLKLLQCIECPAVLDQKWCYASSVPTLAVAFASG